MGKPESFSEPSLLSLKPFQTKIHLIKSYFNVKEKIITKGIWHGLALKLLLPGGQE